MSNDKDAADILLPPKAGEFAKVCIPGETPWAECISTYGDGTWTGRIANDVGGVGALHSYKQDEVLRWQPGTGRNAGIWVPAGDVGHA